MTQGVNGIDPDGQPAGHGGSTPPTSTDKFTEAILRHPAVVKAAFVAKVPAVFGKRWNQLSYSMKEPDPQGDIDAGRTTVHHSTEEFLAALGDEFCPQCDSAMHRENEHSRCPACGWIIGCCEGEPQ